MCPSSQQNGEKVADVAERAREENQDELFKAWLPEEVNTLELQDEHTKSARDIRGNEQRTAI
jgi:hypothetical protein